MTLHQGTANVHRLISWLTGEQRVCLGPPWFLLSSLTLLQYPVSIGFIHNPVLPGGPELVSNVAVSEYDVHPGLTEVEIQFSVLNTSSNETLNPSFWIVGGEIGEWGLWWVSSNADFVTCDGCDDPIPPGETRTISFHINLEGWFSSSRWDGDYHVVYIRFEDWGGRYQLNNSGNYTLGQCFNVCYNCSQGAQSTQRIEALESGSCPDYCGGAPTPTPQPTETPQPTNTPEPTATPPSSPADLKQASNLEFSPPDPSVGDTVHFWFRVRNDGGEAIEVTEIGPFGYGPGSTPNPWDANRHGNLEIAPNGGEETIHGYRTFDQDEAGTWTIDAIHYQLVSDPEPRSYYILNPNGYRPPPAMDVDVRGPSDLRQCLDLEIHPDPPIMLGKEVRFCTDLCNYGDQPSVFKYFGPEGRDPDDRNWDAFIEDDFSIPPDSHPYTFDMYARFYKPGEWQVDRLAVQVNDNWLTRYTLPSDGHPQSFCFDVVADPDHLVTFVEVIGSDREYRVVENLGVGDRYYTDRDYTILSLPEGFGNLTWIMTSNEDDRQTREEFLYFALNNDADVFIAYDQRVDPLPNWMDGFEDTGLLLEVSDGMASPLRIYRRHYTVGKVTLGGNLGPGSGNNDPVSNYVVMVGGVLLGDFNCDCVVDVADVMQVASRWRCQIGDDCYHERYDLDKDGDIDVVDIMLVAAQWGETCP